MNYKLIDNTKKKQYEFQIDGFVAKIEYIKAQNNIYLTHTEVPTQIGGKGIGTELVKQVLDDVKQKDLVLIPLCPFVALYIKRNPEWRELVLKGITIV